HSHSSVRDHCMAAPAGDFFCPATQTLTRNLNRPCIECGDSSEQGIWGKWDATPCHLGGSLLHCPAYMPKAGSHRKRYPRRSPHYRLALESFVPSDDASIEGLISPLRLWPRWAAS